MISSISQRLSAKVLGRSLLAILTVLVLAHCANEERTPIRPGGGPGGRDDGGPQNKPGNGDNDSGGQIVNEQKIQDRLNEIIGGDLSKIAAASIQPGIYHLKFVDMKLHAKNTEFVGIGSVSFDRAGRVDIERASSNTMKTKRSLIGRVGMAFALPGTIEKKADEVILDPKDSMRMIDFQWAGMNAMEALTSEASGAANFNLIQYTDNFQEPLPDTGYEFPSQNLRVIVQQDPEEGERLQFYFEHDPEEDDDGRKYDQAFYYFTYEKDSNE